jgi:hypothetical protein
VLSTKKQWQVAPKNTFLFVDQMARHIATCVFFARKLGKKKIAYLLILNILALFQISRAINTGKNSNNMFK